MAPTELTDLLVLLRQSFQQIFGEQFVEMILYGSTVVELGQTILLAATDLLSQYSLSYWDSLIVAGALASGAPVLYSEDMQDGILINQRLTIINPLK